MRWVDFWRLLDRALIPRYYSLSINVVKANKRIRSSQLEVMWRRKCDVFGDVIRGMFFGGSDQWILREWYKSDGSLKGDIFGREIVSQLAECVRKQIYQG